MTDVLFRIFDEVASLPGEQVEILIPVLVSTFLQKAPKGVAVPASLKAVVDQFWAEMRTANPEDANQAVVERMEAVGLTKTVVRALLAKADVDVSTVDSKLIGSEPIGFEPRATPGPDETRAGPLARFELLKPGAR